MSEPKNNYETEADRLAEQGDVEEAVKMLGKGYDSTIVDEAPHDHYSQIPNIVDDYGLSPIAYRLYGHLRRVAGEQGKCWQSTSTLAEACNMSAGSISNAKKELLDAEIPLIRVRKVPMRTGFSYDEITLADLWKVNHDVYQERTVHILNGSPHERAVHLMKQRISLRKNNPKSSTTTPAKKSNVFALYESNIGPLTPLIADALKDAEQTYSSAWVARAIPEAALSGVRNMKYINSILAGYKERGSPDIGRDKTQYSKGKPNATHQPNSPQPTEADLALARQIKAERALQRV